MIGMISLNLNEIHRLINDCKFADRHINRSNIQNNVTQDEITRKENENSYSLQAHHACPTNLCKICRDDE